LMGRECRRRRRIYPRRRISAIVRFGGRRPCRLTFGLIAKMKMWMPAPVPAAAQRWRALLRPKIGVAWHRPGGRARHRAGFVYQTKPRAASRHQ
jgi:hypothetical protein